jgi:hypothetical protein
LSRGFSKVFEKFFSIEFIECRDSLVDLPDPLTTIIVYHNQERKSIGFEKFNCKQIMNVREPG